MAKKSSIHIKPSHKGRFTSYCKSKGYSKVTQKCINKGKKSKSTKIRKEANFADVAKNKFKHKGKKK